jgi:F-type H+-transporting ATPase subunit epsilon
MMNLEIVSPEKKLYKGSVRLVQVPGKKGSFEVLENHAPIISTLEAGSVKIETNNNDVQYFEITGGVIEVKKNNIIVLVEM